MLICLIGAGPGFAQGFDGRYQIDRCTDELTDGGMSIDGTRLRYWETSCDLSNPVAVRDMAGATLFDAACESEGERSVERLLLMRGGSISMPGIDLILLRPGQVVLYQRCD
jgi:hypothetical protein